MTTETLPTRRVALITGCSEPESIGASMARQLYTKGWRVFATARKVETMAALKELGCDVLELDVTSDKSVRAAVGQVKSETDGRLDLLVNNAGVSVLAPLLDMDVSRMQAVYDVNVFGGVRMLQACAKMLIRTANDPASGKGTVINVVSTARYMPPWQGAYGSSKAAFGALSDTMRVELAPLGVKVITVNLGSTNTAMLAGLKEFPIKRPVEDRFPAFAPYDTVITPKFKNQLRSNYTSAQIADQLIAAAEKNSPPRIMWPGTATWLFRYITLRLPTSWADALWTKVAYVNEVKLS